MKKPRSIFLYTGICFALLCFMLCDPRTTLEASRAGLVLWFNTVLPALFPFLVICELIMGLGLVQFLGVLLEPLMRPLFGLPGPAGFVVAMGFTSGFPVGAVITNRLYHDRMLSTSEAERLVSFTNNASPLFILGVIGVGLFQSTSIGYLLAASHYLSNILVGIITGRSSISSWSTRPAMKQSLLSRATARLLQAHAQDPIRPGQLLGDAIKTSINNILTIGGFVIIFSVITSALSTWGITSWLAELLKILGGISYSSATGLVVGVFEMTLGAQSLALSQGFLLEKLLAVSAILAWSGFSIQAQIMSIMAATPVRFTYYLRARLLQMALSTIITWAGFRFLSPLENSPVFYSLPELPVINHAPAFFKASWQGLGISLMMLALMVTTTLAYHYLRRSAPAP